MEQTTGFIKTNCIKSYVLWCGLVLLFSVITNKILAQQSQTIPNGGIYSGFTFPVTGCVYNWANDNPSIGLGAGGSTTIPSFTAINKSTKPVKANITVSTTAVNASGYLIGGDGIGVFNFTTNTYDKQLPVSNVVTTAFSPDGSVLYVFGTDQPYNITLINTFNNTVTGSIPIDFYVTDMVMSRDGNTIYVPADNSGVKVINTVSKSVTTINLGPGSKSSRVVLSPDGKTLYSSNRDNIVVINTADNTIATTYPVPSSATLTISTDGKRLYMGAADIIYVMDTASGSVSNIQLNTPAFGSLLQNPDGVHLYFTDGGIRNTNRVHFVDIRNGIDEAIDVSSDFFYLAMSDDGGTLYATDFKTGNVSVINTATKQITAKIPVNATRFDATSSSRGTMRHGGGQFYVISNYQNSTLNYSTLTVINTSTNQKSAPVTLPVAAASLTAGTAEIFCNSPPKTFTITVDADPPAINVSGPLKALTTSYGTPSASANISVSGIRVDAGILVTAPAGFEVSADNVTFGKTVTIGNAETIPPTNVYIRLNATAISGSYSGGIVLTAGSTTVNIPTATSTVTKAPLQVIAANTTKVYGATLKSTGRRANVFTTLGLKNGEVIGDVALAFATGSAPADGARTYKGSVKATAAGGGTFSVTNYDITYTDGDIIVTPAPLIITADDKEKYFNEANPELTVSYSGFVNNENASQLTIAPVASTIATVTSPVGFYPITVSGAVADNYTISYVPGTLNILQKDITPSTAFTPNGDSINDTWTIKSIAQYPKCSVEIMDRSGSIVFNSIGYATAWDGTYRGNNLPTGTYYYVIKLTASLKPLTGSLTIIR